MTKEEYKAYIISHLNDKGIKSFSEYEKVSQSFIILLRGKRVKMRSGKAIWNSIGAAKNALRCHLENIHYSQDYYLEDENGKKSWGITDSAQREAENEWIANNIRFVPLSEYLALRQKTKKK